MQPVAGALRPLTCLLKRALVQTGLREIFRRKFPKHLFARQSEATMLGRTGREIKQVDDRVVPLFGMIMVTNRDDGVLRQAPLQQDLLGDAAVVGAPGFLLPFVERAFATL